MFANSVSVILVITNFQLLDHEFVMIYNYHHLLTLETAHFSITLSNRKLDNMEKNLILKWLKNWGVTLKIQNF